MCLHRPAAAVGGGASGGGRRPGLPREHHYPMCQGQPLFWPVGEKSSRRSATRQTRYDLRDTGVIVQVQEVYKNSANTFIIDA